MRSPMKKVLAAGLVVLAMPFFAMPSSAVAEPTADDHFMADLNDRNIPHPTPDAEAIKLAHIIVDDLVQNPTMREVGSLTGEMIDVSTSAGSPMTVEQAVGYIRLAVHYYGPPWLRDTLDQQSQAP